MIEVVDKKVDVRHLMRWAEEPGVERTLATVFEQFDKPKSDRSTSVAALTDSSVKNRGCWIRAERL